MSSEKKQKKEQILTAANECFVKYGYKKTTLEDIGKNVGLNKASLYYYFKSKEEIFTSLVLNEFQQFISKLHQDIEDGMDCEQKILVYFKEKLYFWHQKSIILPQITETDPKALQHLMTSGLDVYSKIEREEQSFVATILKKCVKNGQIKEYDAEKTSGFLFALVDGVKEKCWGFTGSTQPPQEEYEKMVADVQSALKIFINGLK